MHFAHKLLPAAKAEKIPPEEETAQLGPALFGPGTHKGIGFPHET
jgi:hypothetical protein